VSLQIHYKENMRKKYRPAATW